MSNTDRSTVTRRRALQTGSLAAIAAGLLRTTVPAVAAEPAMAPVVNADDLTERCQKLWDTFRETLGRAHKADDPEQSDLLSDSFIAEYEWRITEVARHLPGLAPTLLMLWNHVDAHTYGSPGACYRPESRYEA